VEGTVVANDIVNVRLSLQAPLFADSYEAVRCTGALILIDEATNQTVACRAVR
jgi:sulfate adenylyltransferase subunit 1